MKIKVHIDRVELQCMTYKKIQVVLRSMGLDTSKEYWAWDDPAMCYSKTYSGEAIEQMGVA